MMMIRKILIGMLAILLITCACSRDEELEIDEFVFVGQDIDTTTALGKKVNEIKEKYQSNIIYNWDVYLLGNGAYAVPPVEEKVLPFIEFLEEVWFKPYGNDEFLLQNLPREIILVGGSINYGEAGGSANLSVPGQADSQYRIVLGDVNSFSNDYNLIEKLSYKQYVERITHHEFAHILNKRYDLPEAYGELSKGLYLRNTSHNSLPVQEAYQRGFIRPYGATNIYEDFATLVEFITTNSREAIFDYSLSEFDAQGQIVGAAKGIDDYEKLYLKYQMVLNYYNDLGVDVQQIGDMAAYHADSVIQVYIDSLNN